MHQLTYYSPAKLNLMLHITGRRADGYHHLQTIFQLIDLTDTLQFTLRHDSTISLQDSLVISDNLVVRAARLLQQEAQCSLGCHIELNKCIPMGAGLGGGSSNAATTLLALNELWNIRLTLPQLATLGLQLGADVPVFIYGHSCWAEGIGEHLQPLVIEPFHYIVLTPDVHCSTQLIFNHPQLPRQTLSMNKPPHIQSIQDIALYHNDCQAISCLLYPQISEAIHYLSSFGLTRMTGTGCGVFLVHDGSLNSTRILQHAPCSGFICHTWPTTI